MLRWTQEDENAMHAESVRHYEESIAYLKSIGWDGFPPIAKPPEKPINLAAAHARSMSRGTNPRGFHRKGKRVGDGITMHRRFISRSEREWLEFMDSEPR